MRWLTYIFLQKILPVFINGSFESYSLSLRGLASSPQKGEITNVFFLWVQNSTISMMPLYFPLLSYISSQRSLSVRDTGQYLGIFYDTLEEKKGESNSLASSSSEFEGIHYMLSLKREHIPFNVTSLSKYVLVQLYIYIF